MSEIKHSALGPQLAQLEIDLGLRSAQLTSCEDCEKSTNEVPCEKTEMREFEAEAKSYNKKF